MPKPKKFLSSNEIRRQFLNYFVTQCHTHVASSSLVPANDPTLLFNNAGMVQFKETFLGIEQRPYTRATSAQRCVRAGGKHNDLDNVGYTRRHHTFFEMLGNFSFGDYFKREAITFAWEFLTQVLALPAEKLWVTVFEEDKESEAIWLTEIGVDAQRFSRCGAKDNFWQMGDVGPCGPCTEIFYDHGVKIAGGPPGSVDEDGDRYVEIWNLVFMQYQRDAKGVLHPLPKPCVDTGMGLERIAAVLQGVHDNYDTDIFQHLLKALAVIIPGADQQAQSRRVVVDHIRSVAFLIVDGILPANEGRGYVLRRIIRRAIRHGNKLGADAPFFYKMVAPLVAMMGEAYPELAASQQRVERVIQEEEQQFAKTLTRGLKQLAQRLAQQQTSVLPGDLVFQLYDTYGFPPDLTADIARERGMTIDEAGFEAAMQAQRQQSQQVQAFKVDLGKAFDVDGVTEFLGYQQQHATANVLALFDDKQQRVAVLKECQPGVLVLDKTPFYAESGGQVGDSGWISFANGRFCVQDTQKQGSVYLHKGYVAQGEWHEQQTVTASIDQANRRAIAANHTATHLLHAALRKVLGEQVAQKGSLVRADGLRFDFSHNKPLTSLEWRQVEQQVNQQIQSNCESDTQETTPDAAKAAGALALFGERYAERVRVIRFGDFSTEICGGTHVARTGDIGLFVITSESACAAGVRRIQALSGASALNYCQQQRAMLQETAVLLKTDTENLAKRLQQFLQEHKTLQRQLASNKQQHANQQQGVLLDQIVELAGIKVLAAELPGVDSATLRNTLDQLKQSLTEAAIVLASVDQGKIRLVATVSPSCLAHFNAVELLNQVAHQVGGKGGGRPDLAQGGGTNTAALKQALASVADWVASKISG